ncbi:MAG: tripartite tricarboxylate transporter substrate binding protein [Sedimenticolaceae bacterium]
MRHLSNFLLGTILAVSSFASPVFGSDYPDRPLMLFTMTQPGAQIDRLTRGMAERMGKLLGQPVTVRNITGGSHGSVMATELSKAKPDGYTLAIAATTAYTYQPHHAPVKYSFDDFDYITLVALNSSGFISSPDKPWDTLKGAFDWAKANNKALVVMFHGADDRDVIQRIAKQEGVNISLIPSKGGPSVIKAVTGGHADIGYVGAILYEHVRAGRLKLVASALNQRLPPIPDVPTLKEMGYDESVEMYVGLIAPKGIPADRLAKLEAVMEQLAADPETQQFITEQLLMRPVEWGSAHAKVAMKEMYDLFGKQAQSMK